MNIEIRDIAPKDHARARKFAVKGMHFEWYLDSKLLLWLYGLYFWFLEISRATQVMAAYADGRFVGVLLAEVYGEKPMYRSVWKKLYVMVFEFLQNTFYKGGADVYEETTKQLLEAYRENYRPDGEIIFLAADPEGKIKGVGTALLNELELREPGKTIFLHTDNACTYQFYERRGFARVGEKHITMDLRGKKVPLECYLYTKTIL